MLKYLSKKDIEALAPEKIELGKVNRAQVESLSKRDVVKLRDEVDTSSETGMRDLAIIDLLLASGLRVSELSKLNREDIDSDTREFTVRGKGNKDRLVFVTKNCMNTISNYLSARSDNLQPLFIQYSRFSEASRDGDYRRLTPRSIQRLLAKYGKHAGIKTNVSPHKLRHTYATRLLTNGADIRSVQMLLGHSDISTTQIYTHLTDKELRSAYEAASS
jgi:site-specific recombinase XerD